MKVKITRVDKDLPLPKYETAGAVAFDVLVRVTTVIDSQSIGRVPVNVIVEIPKGYMLLLKDRSSTAKKKGLICTPGFVDQDFCGDGDEICLQFFNFLKEPVTLERGERLGQAAFVRVDIAEWEEVESMAKPTRGGFGSTDKKVTKKKKRS